MENALYEIRYHLTSEILMEHYSISISLKKRIFMAIVLSLILAAVSWWSLTSGALIAGYTCEVLAIFAFLYPLRVKHCVKKFYQQDENIFSERTLRLYDDHLELITATDQLTANYHTLKGVTQGKHGAYIHLNSIKAICVPKDALTPETLRFISTTLTSR